NGFGSQTVSTLTASGTIVTATFGSAHNFMQYQVIEIAGATQTEYNGEHRILTVPNANSITFQLAAAPSVTTATGTITCSLPSLGWLKPFSGTGKAAYRSSNTLLASRPYLRVVDALDPAYTSTYAKYAKVGIVEDMTDIDTLIGIQAPYDSANPNKNWVGTGSGASVFNGWAKWYYARNGVPTASVSDTAAPATGNRAWVIVGNKDWFYVFNSTVTSNTDLLSYGFGSFESALSTDSANTFLSCTYTYVNASALLYPGDTTALTRGVQDSLLLQRKYDMTGVPSTARISTIAFSNFAEIATGVAAKVTSYAGNIPFAPTFIFETGSIYRGMIPNLYWLFQVKPFTHLTPFTKSSQIYLPINVTSNTSSGQLVLGLGSL
ncbi:MAG: hypothetical protein RSA84_22150, partial [Acinetobacter sp.]